MEKRSITNQMLPNVVYYPLPQLTHLPWNRWPTSLGGPHRVELLPRLKRSPQFGQKRTTGVADRGRPRFSKINLEREPPAWAGAIAPSTRCCPVAGTPSPLQLPGHTTPCRSAGPIETAKSWELGPPLRLIFALTNRNI
ncbi:hypothetical protein DFAR_2690009 [Desulfarculales bacterium]